MNYSMVTRTDSFRRDVRGEVQVVRTLNLSCDGKKFIVYPRRH
jgi:hypothetical protein